jgi:hypothetical protein
MKNKFFQLAVYISFGWNIYLVSGVMLGATYALDRAAGGQFEVFPPSIRIIYIVNLAVILYQVFIFNRFVFNKTIKPQWIVKAFVTISVLGILANAASRSANERWNVIPAGIITYAFFKILKTVSKDSEATDVLGNK